MKWPKSKNTINLESKVESLEHSIEEASASMSVYHNLFNDLAFTGEKNTGELPDVPAYFVDYQTLAKNAYNVYLKTDNIQNIVNRTCNDAIGTGLLMDYKPDNEALKALGLKEITPEEERTIQALWRTWSASTRNDVRKEISFNQGQKSILHGATVGGDIFLLPHVKGSKVTFQIIDGSLVDGIASNATNEKEVIEGVELDKSSNPIAFHVWDIAKNAPRRIARFSKAFNLERIFQIKSPLVYRPNDVRGVSAIGAILEKARKTDRAIEASASNMEELAKNPYWIEADKDVEAEKVNGLADRFNANLRSQNTTVKPGLTASAELAAFRKNMMASYEKTIRELPPGYRLENFEFNQVKDSEVFIKFLEDGMGLTVGMPPEVLRQSFESNYTAARASILGWYYTLDEVYRHTIAEQLNKKMFQFWLAVMASNRVIRLDGYINALIADDAMAIEAYTKSQWIGRKAPQIDPLKEAKAFREMLGPEFAHIPLTTVRRVIAASNEKLDTKSFIDSIIEELKAIEKLPNSEKAAALRAEKKNADLNKNKGDGKGND